MWNTILLGLVDPAFQTIDGEINLIMMGERMFDKFSGMFTSPDPLMDYFPTQSTYSYAMNNPLRMKDQSGLAPEGEKYEDKLQTKQPPPIELLYELIASLQRVENEKGLICVTRCHDSADELALVAKAYMDANNALMYALSIGSGGSSSGSSTSTERTGESGGQSNNGTEKTEFTSIRDKSWDDMDAYEKKAAVQEGLDYIAKKQKETGNEWGFAIAETKNNDGTYTIKCYNITTSKNTDGVEIDYSGNPEGSIIVGDAHSHPDKALPSFSTGDISNYMISTFKTLEPNKRDNFMSFVINASGNTWSMKFISSEKFSKVFDSLGGWSHFGKDEIKRQSWEAQYKNSSFFPSLLYHKTYLSK